MKIITANVNGIRAAATKGFYQWMQQQHADVVCIQETKAQQHQLVSNPQFFPQDHHCYYHDAVKKGYSGVAIYTRHPPDSVFYGMGHTELDQEGRYLEVRLGNLSVVSLYMPSGTSGEERQRTKFACMQHFQRLMQDMKQSGRDYIICGDWNIAHKPIDLKNWKSNQKTTGFLPEERAWLDSLFDEMGFVDGFREINSAAEQYTWWSTRARAWENNVGWRIDYQILSPSLKGTVKNAAIYREQRFSDHAPLILEYDYSLV